MRLETVEQATGGGAPFDEARLEFHMRRQYGLVSLVQARSAGMSRQQIHRRVDASRWRRVGPRVYQNSAVPITPHSKLLAACIAYDGLASHRSAAALHGIEGFSLGRPELVVGQNRARSAVGVIVHRSAQMDSTKPVTLHGMPCTGLSRTVLDLAAVVSRERLERAIDAVFRDGRLRYHDLFKVLDAHARNGRTGTCEFRAVLDERAGESAVPLSDWSRWVRDLICEASLPKPVLEYQVHTVEGDFVAQVDLAYPQRHLAIELDSIRWHHNRDSFVNDRRRRNRLMTAGWDVLSFTWHDCSEQPAALCDVVARALNGTASR